MDVYDIRRANFAAILAADQRTQASIAEAIDAPAAYTISQLKTGAKTIGDIWARRIETHWNYEQGWLDREHEGVAPLVGKRKEGETTDPEEQLILGAYRSLSPDARNEVRALIISLLHKGTSRTTSPAIPGLKIPGDTSPPSPCPQK